MNCKTFELEIQDGILVIPSEIQAYLALCQTKVKVSVTIKSTSSSSNELKEKWEIWLNEVKKIEPLSSVNEDDNYGKLLVDKYKKQGLIL